MELDKIIYSRIDEVPNGRASENYIHGCLVLEGGAFRGLYTQGFLDAMMENDLNLDTVIGVSAGALGGMNYTSGQIGRAARINLIYRHDSRYVGTKAVLNSKSILDLGFIMDDKVGVVEAFDRERFYSKKTRFVAVATNCLTGRAEYFEKNRCADIFKAVRASATMPYISPVVNIDGVPYLDGGCSCPIPYHWALRRNFKKILVIKTRDLKFRYPNKMLVSNKTIYRKYPELGRRLTQKDISYNRRCDEIELLHARGELFRVAPKDPIEVARVDGDMEKLGNLYWQGYNQMYEMKDELKEYLLH